MKDFNKLQVSDEEALKFIEPAMHVVDTEYTALDEDKRTRAIMEVSTNMAAGSAWTKGKYLLMGIGLGVAYAVAGIFGYGLSKKDWGA